MSDETKPARKRQFFQVHLSTAIIMMLAAGFFLWANVRGGDWIAWRKVPPLHKVYGFPFPFDTDLPTSAFTLAIVYDALIGFYLLALVWLVCESHIRRRAARKEK